MCWCCTIHLKSCWSPCFWYGDVVSGSLAVSVYSLAMSICLIVYTINVMTGGDSSQLYLPFFWDKFKRFNWTWRAWINNWHGWLRHHFLRFSVRCITPFIVWGSSRYTWIYATLDVFDVGRDRVSSHVRALADIWLLHLFGGHHGSRLWLDLDDVQHLLLLCSEIPLPKREAETTSRHWIFQWNVK